MNRNFKQLSVAYAVSLVGDWLYKLALPLLIYQYTGSAFYMALTYGVTYIPSILFTIIGGIAADTFDKKKVLVLGDAFSAVVLLLLFTMLSIGVHNPVMMMFFAFFLSTASAFYYSSHQSIIPEIVSDEQYTSAIARFRMIDNMILILGPPLSGIVIAVVSAEISILVNGLSFLLSAIIIQLISRQPPQISVIKISDFIRFDNIQQKSIEGMRIAFSIPLIRRACCVFILVNIAISLFFSNFIFVLKSEYQLAEAQIGLVYSLIGVGAFCGSFVSKLILKRLAEYQTIMLSTAVSMCLFLGLYFSSHYLQTALSWALITFCNAVTIVSYFTLRQKLVPKDKLGIVVSITRTMVILCIPIGSVAGGYLIGLLMSSKPLILISLGLMLMATIYGVLGLFSGEQSPQDESLNDQAKEGM